MLTRIRIVDGAHEMLLRPRAGIAHASLDPGWASPREVVEDRPDTDGTFDDTQNHGASAVTVTLTLYEANGTRAVLDEIGPFMHASRRPYLVVEDDEWAGPRQILLRSDQMSRPIERGRGVLRDVQVGWKAPDGQWEAVDQVALTVPVDVPSSSGRTYPRVYPWSYTPTLGSGAITTTNVGGKPSHIVARMYGPITAPRLENVTTGEVIAFTAGLVLGVGEYVEVSTLDRTARFLSRTELTYNRHGLIDFPDNSWWRLQPGLQTLRYTGESVALGAAATVYYRPAWL